MGELENYSIETDHTVLLAFRDGRRLRVPVDRLPGYLKPRDLAKVRAALKLRRDFIRKHMPKTALVLAAGGLVALFAVSGRIVATALEPHGTAPATTDHTAIVRNVPLPEPPEPQTLTPSSAPQPITAATPAPRAHHAVAKTKHASAVIKAITQPSPPPVVPAGPTPLPAPSPTPSPVPIADNNPPAAQSSPSPAPAPNQGEVLGDSTGPGDTPQIP